MQTRWFSIRKADFGQTLFFGIGVGGDLPEVTFALFFVFGSRVITFGPHK
jgi:hypothetical protein